MAYFGKEFKLEKQDNYEDLLRTLQLPEESIKNYTKQVPSQKLEKNGDTYTLTTKVLDTGKTAAMTFKSGVEFDEKKSDTLTIKSTITVDGDIVTHVQKLDADRTLVLKKEMSAKGITETITTNFWPGTARRYYS